MRNMINDYCIELAYTYKRIITRCKLVMSHATGPSFYSSVLSSKLVLQHYGLEDSRVAVVIRMESAGSGVILLNLENVVTSSTEIFFCQHGLHYYITIYATARSRFIQRRGIRNA